MSRLWVGKAPWGTRIFTLPNKSRTKPWTSQTGTTTFSKSSEAPNPAKASGVSQEIPWSHAQWGYFRKGMVHTQTQGCRSYEWTTCRFLQLTLLCCIMLLKSWKPWLGQWKLSRSWGDEKSVQTRSHRLFCRPKRPGKSQAAKIEGCKSWAIRPQIYRSASVEGPITHPRMLGVFPMNGSFSSRLVRSVS